MPYKDPEKRRAAARKASLKYSRAHREEHLARAEKWNMEHPDERRENSALWRSENQERVKEHRNNWRAQKPDYFIDHRYGDGAGQHLRVQVEKQSNRCAVCGDPLVSPCLDHNHETGEWRGALCRGCNARLGTLENFEWMKKATDYLNQWGGVV